MVLKFTIPKGESSYSIAFLMMGILFYYFTVKKDDSENITLFWVELIPIIGWLYYV